MITDDGNVTVNYNRYHTRDVNKTARELSPERKQKLLDEIQLRKGVSYLNSASYDKQTCKRIEKLLSEEAKC